MTIFYLPDLGEGLAEAEIREWYVKIGDTVAVDQPLVSMETAKAVVDVPSPYAGKITGLNGNVNEMIQTGAPLVYFELAENTQPMPTKGSKHSVVGALQESSQKWHEDDVIVGNRPIVQKSQQIKAMPAARVLAKELNVDLNLVKGTGAQGLITTADVKSYANTNQSAGLSTLCANDFNGHQEVLHGVRRTMSTVMSQAHQEVVAVTIIDEADITNFPKEADFTAHLLKAIVFAAKQEPALNAWFDGKTLTRRVFEEINIGIAMDAAEGLFVPVIKNIAQYDEKDLRQMINELKTAVQNRSLKASDMQGATISLSNFGTIAGRYATPIVVPPTVAIVGTGRGREAALARDGQVVAGRVVPLSLTFDHRVVTGGEAARFLAAMIEYLQGS